MSTMRKNVFWNLENEWREINFLFESFLKYGMLKEETKKMIRPFSIHEKQRIINDLTMSLSDPEKYNLDTINGINGRLYTCIPTNRTAHEEEIKLQFIMYFNRQCIKKEDISWITERNSYLIEYLWGYINIAKQPYGEQFLTLPKFYKIGNYTTDNPVKIETIIDSSRRIHLVTKESREKYKDLNIDLTVETGLSKYQLIMLFFDLIKGDVEIKKRQLDVIHDKWCKIEKNNKFRNWADQNYDILEWALTYIKNNCLFGKLPLWMINPDNHNESERANKIQLSLTTFYNLIESDEAKQLLLNLLSRAGAQHRYKKKSKQEYKESLNVYISKEHKKIFDEIKKDNNLTAELTLQRIIDFYNENNLPHRKNE